MLADDRVLGQRISHGQNRNVKPSLVYASWDEMSKYIGKPATQERMDKFTLVHTQIQIIIIHFLPSSFALYPMDN
jgi:hypothetical protein